MSQSSVNDRIYAEALEILKKKYSEITINLWFKSLSLIKIEDNLVVLKAESDFKKTIAEQKYIGDLQSAFKEILDFEPEIAITLTGEIQDDVELPMDEEIRTSLLTDGNNPGGHYTFENFVVGTTNQFAWAASNAVAKNPSDLYNPLFIYGPSGIGKTHLLFSIFNYVNSHSLKKYKIVYVTGEEFTNRILEAINEKSQNSFREKFRTADMLLVDDVQFIAGKKAIQEEFFHTFNSLFEQKKQIVLTSDKSPGEIAFLEDRLKSRFTNGLIADIQSPDLELRTVIFKRKADAFGVDIPFDVLTYLAENIKDNVRQIEGAIKTLKAYSFINGKEISYDMAKTALSDFFTKIKTDGISADKIVDFICKKYAIQKSDLLSESRAEDIAYVRHITVYILRTLINPFPYEKIAIFLSRNHSTIITSYKGVVKKMKVNAAYNREVTGLIKEIKNSLSS